MVKYIETFAYAATDSSLPGIVNDNCGCGISPNSVLRSLIFAMVISLLVYLVYQICSERKNDREQS